MVLSTGGEPGPEVKVAAIRVLDGAMGTELLRRGHDLTPPLWSARPLFTSPEVVVAIHAEYIASGADIITTDTFRTNPRTFREGGLDTSQARQATHLAVQCARTAVLSAPSRPVRVAGSMAPVADCYHPELVPGLEELLEEHRALATWLAQAGVDLAIAETMNTLREGMAAVTAAVEVGMEAWASFICQPSFPRLLSGEPLDEAVQAVVERGASAVGVNCVPPGLVPQCIDLLRSTTDLPILVYPNGGKVASDGRWHFDSDLTPQRYGEYCLEWLDAGASIIGGCCGTGPAHIQAVRNTVDNWWRHA